MSPVRLLAVVFALSLLSGFGVGHLVPEEATSQVAASPPSTTEAPPSPAADGEPLRVVLAGDSVMAGLVPAVAAALEPTGATVDFVLTPTILRDPSVRFSWSQELAELDPDVVVMFVGTWEARDEEGASGDPGWALTYRAEVVEPWLELITGAGASVTWIGAPPVPGAERAAFFGLLNGVFASLPATWPQVTYLDPSISLGPAGADYLAVLVLPDGTTARLRQIDDLHLCPVGAQLLAEQLVASLAEGNDLDVPDGWQEGEWQRDEELYDVAGCPPVLPG